MSYAQILNGWQQIENYLKMNRKTIIARGFPVRKWGGVYAMQAELDAHIATRQVLAYPAGKNHNDAGIVQPSQ